LFVSGFGGVQRYRCLKNYFIYGAESLLQGNSDLTHCLHRQIVSATAAKNSPRSVAAVSFNVQYARKTNNPMLLLN
jgi:hypothetical protein